MAFQLGKWHVICDRCGFKRFNDEVTKTWDGFMVCAKSTGKTCYETRHPQEFVRTKADDTSVSFVRSRPTDIFVEVDTIDSSVGTQENTIPSGTPGNGSTL